MSENLQVLITMKSKMKKVKRFLMVMGLGAFFLSSFNVNMYAQYQLENSGFEDSAYNGIEEWDGSSAEMEPKGWNSFMGGAGTGLAWTFGKKNQMSRCTTDLRTGTNGKVCALITSRDATLAIANGNLTTGRVYMGSTTPKNSGIVGTGLSKGKYEGNFNYTDLSDSRYSRGFKGMPDFISVWIKYIPANDSPAKGENKAGITAILHTEVPNTYTIASATKTAAPSVFQDPMPNGTASDVVEYTNKLLSHQVAKAKMDILPNGKDWQQLMIPFVYDNKVEPSYALVSFTTNIVPGEGSIGDALYIDDIEIIYNSQLSTLTYNGTTIEGFAIDNYETLDMSSVIYDASKLAYTSNGVGATVEPIYDSSTNLLTITVKGNDYSVNASNNHIYKIQFGAPKTYTSQLVSLSVNGSELTNFDKDNTYYTVIGDYTDGSIVTIADEDATVDIIYDETSRIATITVKGGDIATNPTNTHTYYVKFARETATYNGKLLIKMMGDMLSASDEPVGISSPINNKVDFQLLNFSLEGIGLIGDIFVTDVPYVPATDGSVTLYKEQTIVIFGAAGTSLGELPVTLTGEIVDGELTATIDIEWSGIPIQVSVYPFSTTSIDVSDVAGADVFIPVIKSGLTNPNCLIYVQEGTTVEAADIQNVVIGTNASSIVITDKVPFNAPKAFTADAITYTRNCYTDGGWETIALPFAVSNVSGTYKLEMFKEATETTVKFEEATTWEANTAYLFSLNGDGSNVDCTFTGSGAIEPATWAGKFRGTFETMDAVGKYVMGADGNSFVLGVEKGADRAYVEPFRAYLDETAVPNRAPSYLIGHEGDATGMDMQETVNAVYVSGNAIIVNSSEATAINVYDVVGKLVRTVTLNEGENTINGLPAGFYVVNGHKVVIK